MSERAPTTYNHEQTPREQDPGADFIDAARELRESLYENLTNTDSDLEPGQVDDRWEMFDTREDPDPDGLKDTEKSFAILQYLAEDARKNGEPHELKPFEKTLLEHFKTEAAFNSAQARVDMLALEEPIEGVDNPRVHRVNEIIEKLRADNDPANEDKIRTLEQYNNLPPSEKFGNKLVDFVMSHQVVEATHDDGSRELAKGIADKTANDLHVLSDQNVMSIEAYKILTEYYPAEPVLLDDLEQDPRLEYVAAKVEDEPVVAPAPDVAEPTPAQPVPVAETAPATIDAAKAAEQEAQAHLRADRKIAEAELNELRAKMAKANRGFFSQPSPELEAEYMAAKRNVGKLWLEDTLKTEKLTNPTAKQLAFYASQFAVLELGNLTSATNSEMEKTVGAKFRNLVDKHPVLMGGAALGLLGVSGVGLPAAIAGAAGMVVYTKLVKKFRGNMRSADKMVSNRELRNDMIIGSVNMDDGSVDYDKLFDSAAEHIQGAYTAERHRQRLKDMGVPMPDVERYIKRYTRRLGSSALRGMNFSMPGSRPAYA